MKFGSFFCLIMGAGRSRIIGTSGTLRASYARASREISQASNEVWEFFLFDNGSGTLPNNRHEWDTSRQRAHSCQQGNYHKLKTRASRVHLSFLFIHKYHRNQKDLPTPYRDLFFSFSQDFLPNNLQCKNIFFDILY